jgi:hypothetical protein
VDLLADLEIADLTLADLVLPALDLDFFLLPLASVSVETPDFLVLFFSDPAFTLRDFVDFLDWGGLVWGGTGGSVEMMIYSKKFDSVEDDVGVDEGVAVSSNKSLDDEVFECLPPFFFLLALALEAFDDLVVEAEAADLDLVTRMIGRSNSVGSFKRVVSFGSAAWTEEVEI